MHVAGDVGDLCGDEAGCWSGEAANAVRLHCGGPPRCADTARREMLDQLGHRAAGPVGDLARRLGAGERPAPGPRSPPATAACRACASCRAADRPRPPRERRCQRHTAGRLSPARRMPRSRTDSRSAENRTTRRRLNLCFSARLRSPRTAANRARPRLLRSRKHRAMDETRTAVEHICRESTRWVRCVCVSRALAVRVTAPSSSLAGKRQPPSVEPVRCISRLEM